MNTYTKEIQTTWPVNRFGPLKYSVQQDGTFERLEYFKNDNIYGGFDVYPNGKLVFVLFYNNTYSEKTSGVLNLQDTTDKVAIKNIICSLPYD